MPDWRAKRREAILAAADALFAGRSYAEVQMDEVARAAGVGKATLYRYFPSKEDLYLETLERALSRLEDRLHGPADPGAAPTDRLTAMISALIDTLNEQLTTLKLLGGDHSDLADRTRRILRRRSARIAEALRAVLEDGIAAGQFRQVDTAMTPLLVIGMVRGGIMMGGSQPRDVLERAILDLVLAATAAAPPDKPALPSHSSAIANA
ncbi:TetR/AcrR family transcriptional regulator [Azospirillum thermophilum]|nr:TetR/AcrR family transcriptional regulator [Azospirillum thermophilum]